MEPPPPRVGHALLIKKGQIVPENAELMTNADIVKIQEGRIERFKPQKEMRVFTWSSKILGGSVALSGLVIGTMFRKKFRLGGLRRFFTYTPVIVVPTITSLFVHDALIRQELLLGQEKCPVCISLRAGVLQAVGSVCYPWLISLLSCIPVAREFYTLPLHVEKGSGAGSYLRLLRLVTPSSQTLTLLALGNMFLGMLVVNAQMKAFHRHLNHPPTEEDLSLAMKYGRGSRSDSKVV